MIVEIGHFALIAALVTGLVSLLILGSFARTFKVDQVAAGDFLGLCQRSIALEFLLLIVAFSALLYAFGRSDFSVRLVALHSTAAQPLFFRLTALWGNHEGSLLLWNVLLAGLTLWLSLFPKLADSPLKARSLFIQQALFCGFMGLLLLTSNPFERLLPIDTEGQGTNPLLLDGALALHPPFLYMGLAGLSVPFSLALALLYHPKTEEGSFETLRFFSLLAWVFLSLGIGIGSWWAYTVLGWGGFWFWDPVENTSLIPWLFLSGFCHSFLIWRKRGFLGRWSLSLLIGAFLTAIMGFFLVRSGLLVSVHAFLSDPRRGLWLLGILGICFGGAVLIFLRRKNPLSATGGFSPLSFPAILFFQSLLSAAMGILILFGTLYPLMIEALGQGTLAVGAPFFNTTLLPFLLLLLGLLGVRAQKKQNGVAVLGFLGLLPLKNDGRFFRRLFGEPLILTILLGGVLYALLGKDLFRHPGGFLLFLLSAWSLAHIFADWIKKSFWRRPLASWGVTLAHSGFVFVVLGFTAAGLLGQEETSLVRLNQTFSLLGYDITLERIARTQTPFYDERRFFLRFKDRFGRAIFLEPRYLFYATRDNAFSKPALDRQWTKDLYVAVAPPQSASGQPVRDPSLQTFQMRFYTRPLMSFLWTGGLLMVLGIVLRFFKRKKPPVAPLLELKATERAL